MSEVDHLLPDNATPLERALSIVDGERLALYAPQALRTLRDPYTVPASFLPALAVAASVEEEWDLAETEGQQRALIANAYALNAKKGTPYAIKRGLAVLGYPGVTLVEGYAPLRHDGTIRRNGRWQYNSDGFWAYFDVRLPLAAPQGLDAAERARVLRAIEIWQRAACYLRTLHVATVAEAERAAPAEGVPLYHVGVRLTATRATPRDGRARRGDGDRYRYDGRWRHDGSVPRDGRMIPGGGVQFGAPGTQPQIGIHLTLVAERGPALRYDGTIRHDGRFRRGYRGAIGFLASDYPDFSAEFSPEFGPTAPGVP